MRMRMRVHLQPSGSLARVSAASATRPADSCTCAAVSSVRGGGEPPPSNTATWGEDEEGEGEEGSHRLTGPAGPGERGGLDELGVLGLRLQRRDQLLAQVHLR